MPLAVVTVPGLLWLPVIGTRFAAERSVGMGPRVLGPWSRTGAASWVMFIGSLSPQPWAVARPRFTLISALTSPHTRSEHESHLALTVAATLAPGRSSS